MSDIPSELRYAETHEWCRLEDDGLVTVGISDHAQEQLGDLVFVEVPEPGARFEVGEACAVVESVKAASDVYCPISGEVVEVNENLADSPETINGDPYGDGWLMKIRPDDANELDKLLDSSSYEVHLQGQG